MPRSRPGLTLRRLMLAMVPLALLFGTVAAVAGWKRPRAGDGVLIGLAVAVYGPLTVIILRGRI